jgi:hypothetical protein
MPLPCLRVTGHCRSHPVLDALIIDEANDLEHRRPSQCLPLTESSNRIHFSISPTTYEPSRWARARSLQWLGFPTAMSVAGRETMHSHRSSLRLDGWRSSIPLRQPSAADDPTPLVRAIRRQIPCAAGQIWAGPVLLAPVCFDSGLSHFFKENLLSFEFKSNTCKLHIKLNTHPIGLIQFSMSSLWLYLSISTACIIFRYLYTICEISCVDLTLFLFKIANLKSWGLKLSVSTFQWCYDILSFMYHWFWHFRTVDLH